MGRLHLGGTLVFGPHFRRYPRCVGVVRLVAGARQADDEAPPPQHGIFAERCSDLRPYRLQVERVKWWRLQRGAKAQIEAKRTSLRHVGEMKAG